MQSRAWTVAAFLLIAAAAAAQEPPASAPEAPASEPGREPPASESAPADPAQAPGVPDPSRSEADPAASPAPEDLESYAETVVVTASRTEEDLLVVPVSTTVITREQVESSASDNYADLLRGVPGLNVIQLSARDMNFVSRSPTSSLATSQLALVDGRSIYQDFFGFVMWDVLPFDLDEVEQIEVLRGPGSAVWGANALSGVINVRTRSPRDTPGGAFALSAGERNTRSASIRWSDTHREGSAWRLAASWLEQDAWPRPTTLPDGTPLPVDGSFANEGTRQPKLDFRLDLDEDPAKAWSFRAGWSGTSGIMHTGIGPFAIDDATSMAYGEIDYVGNGFEARTYLNWLDGDARNLLNLIDFEFKTKTWVADVTARKVLGERQFLVYGGNFRLNRFDLSIAPRDDARDEAGLFVEDQAELSKWLLLHAGLRVDWFDTIGLTASPRLALVFRPGKDKSLRLAYNRAYRAPSLVQNSLDTQVPNRVELAPGGPSVTFLTLAEGNDALNEETVDALEIGWTSVIREKSTFTAAVYRNEIKDNLDFAVVEYYQPTPEDAAAIGWPFPPEALPPDTFPKRYSYRNIGKVQTQGLELSLNTSWKRGLSTVMSYTWQDRAKASSGASAGGDPLVVNQPSRHQGSVSLAWRGPHWHASGAVSYTDDAFWQDVLDRRYWGTTSSYILVSSAVGWKGERLGFTVKGTNLADEEARQHVFGDIIGRRIVAELKVAF